IDAALAGSGLPPIVASNIHFSKDSKDDDALETHYSAAASDGAPVHPYRVITTSNGVRVGFIGYVGVNAAHVAPNKGPVQFSALGADPKDEGDPKKILPKLYADLQPIVDTLRGEE